MRPLLRLILLAATLLAAALPARAALTLPRAQQAFGFCQSAERAMKAGNLKKARERLSRALEIVPGLPAAHMGLGHLALSEKRFADALREYELARDNYSSLAEALYALHVKDYSDSRNEVLWMQDELRNQQKLAAVPLRLMRLEAALDRLQRMPTPSRGIHEEPPAEIFFYIGNALFHLSRIEEAVAAWRVCLEKDHSFPFVYQNLAVGYWTLGELEKGREILAAANKAGIRVSPALVAELEKSAAGPVLAPR